MNKTKGHYFGQYEILTEKYSGPDFSRRCFVFPGQGAAFPGMFREEFLSFKIIREKFALADSLARELGLPKISDYVLNPVGLKEETLPGLANLAMFTLECALFDVLVSLKITPEIVTGHSFGEYAALVVSGIISFSETFKIVYWRDRFCPPVNAAGFMIAAGADAKKLKDVLGDDYYVSNLNSPRQTVISVLPRAVKKTADSLMAQGISQVVLNVPQPYHSPYLNGAGNKMKKYLKNQVIALSRPRITLFSSVLKKPITKDNFNRSDIYKILSQQLTTPVDFISQIRQIYVLGCCNFLELGSKKLFSVFVENILAVEGGAAKTETAAEILKKEKKQSSRFIDPKNNKLFSLISRTIGKITGYEIERISFEDRFQEDLGIDSIKKAEILLTVLKESDLAPGPDFNTSDFASIKDAADYIAKAQKGGQSQVSGRQRETDFKRYVFELIETPLTEHSSPKKRKNNFFILDAADIFENASKALDGAISFLSKKQAGRTNFILQSNGAGMGFHQIVLIFGFFRELFARIGERDFNLILLSSGAPVSPAVRCLGSFFKSLKKERPEIFFKHIHLNGAGDQASILDREVRDDSQTEVVYKGSKRFVPAPKLVKAETKPKLNKDSIILAIGGAKGITFSLIKNISRRYKPIIYLVGRSQPGEIEANLLELKKSNPKIFYERLDACQIKDLEKVFSKIIKKHGRIDLVINGAGAVRIGFLKDKTDRDISYEFDNKVLPAANILELSRKCKSKRIINFSSVISKYGSAGQTIYTAANALVAGLGEQYNFETKESRVLTVHFPPWNSLGMTGDRGIAQKLKESGVSLLDPAKADELFVLDLSGPHEQVFYLDQADDRLYSFSLNDFKRYERLIGRPADPFSLSASRSVFRKDFDLSKDAYLADHKIKGSSCVPAAVGLSMFLCLGKAYFKKFPILENIFLRNPIVVGQGPLSCRLEAVADQGGRYVFALKSDLTHFYGEALEEPVERARRVPPVAVKEVARDSIYSDYYLNDLYLGPTFQSISRAWLDENDNPFLEVDDAALLPVLGLGIYDRLIQWIDVLFQALGAVGLKENLKMIPVQIGRLIFNSQAEISGRLYVIPVKTRFTKDILRGDVLLVNEKGEVIIRMSDLFLKKINEYPENKLELKN